MRAVAAVVAFSLAVCANAQPPPPDPAPDFAKLRAGVQAARTQEQFAEAIAKYREALRARAQAAPPTTRESWAAARQL